MADTSNLETIQAALVLLVRNAVGVENVYSGSRLTDDWNSFIEQFRDASGLIVHGWTVQFSKNEETRNNSLENEVTYHFVIRGYRTLEAGGDSEAAFDKSLMAVADAVRATHDFTATAELSYPAEVTIKDERVFGGVLVHYGEITVRAQEMLSGD